jgi:hypothetical protein
MKFKVLSVVLALMLTGPAIAGFKTIQEAHEVRLSELRLPQFDGGTVAFKACSACEYEVKLASDDAQWVLDGESMSLEEFRDAVYSLPNRDQLNALVLHHLEQDRITKVRVNVPEAHAGD